MTHCVDFFKKWKREPNFCGIGKTASQRIERYLEFVEDLAVEYKIPIEVAYKNVPLTAASPILKFKPDSDIRKKAAKEIAKTLNNKQGVTGKFVNTVIGITPSSKKFVPKDIPPEPAPPESTKTNKIKDKIRLITSALTPGQLEILIDVMECEHLNNEYEALSLVIKWAGERKR